MYAADFSPIAFVPEQSTFLLSYIDGGVARPEILSPEQLGLEDGRPARRLDCYVLEMKVYEILRGRVPFATSDSIPLPFFVGFWTLLTQAETMASRMSHPSIHWMMSQMLAGAAPVRLPHFTHSSVNHH